MKSTIAQKWIKALRSNKYKQGKMALRTKTRHGTVRHCCLGVLCDLYNKDHKRKLKIKKTNDPKDQGEIDPSTTVFTIGGDPWALPEVVRNWAGIKDKEGMFFDTDPVNVNRWSCNSLSEMNDEGASFKEIAQFIEEHYENL